MSKSLLTVPIDVVLQQQPQKKLIQVDAKDTLPSALSVLAKNNIYAAPVFDSKKKEYLGFIDVIDIVAAIVNIFSETELLGQDFETFTMEDKAKRFESQKSGSIVDLCKRNPWKPVDEKAELAAAISILQQEGLHRIPILKHKTQFNVIHVMTESTVLTYLEKNLSGLGAITKMTVGEMKLGIKKVITVTDKDDAIKTFELMTKHRITAVPIVDSSDGSIISSVSAKDVRVILDAKLSFDIFTKPITEFVAAARDKKKTAFPYISCTQASTLQDIITRLAALRIHRIFVVDDGKVPVGVISLSDVLKMIIQTFY